MSDSRMMVMVASLERHLEEERKILQEAILGQGAIPVGVAYPAIPANYIYKLNLQCVNDADYVVLLIGCEYGALTDKGVGYIHATYAAAKAARKPVVSLIYKGDARHSLDSFDQKRLEGLVDQLKNDSVYFWTDSDSLRDCAELGLENIMETYPSVGWVRADLQPLVPEGSSKDQSMIQKLKQQVNQLKERLQNSEAPIPAEAVEFENDSLPWLVAYDCNAFREGRLKQMDGSLELNLQTVFEWLAPTLLAPVTEAKLRAVLSSRIHADVLKQSQRRWPGCHAVSDVKVQQMSIDELKVRLRSLNAIAFDAHGRWQLTPGGEQVALAR